MHMYAGENTLDNFEILVSCSILVDSRSLLLFKSRCYIHRVLIIYSEYHIYLKTHPSHLCAKLTITRCTNKQRRVKERPTCLARGDTKLCQTKT